MNTDAPISKLTTLRVCAKCFSADCEETAWIKVNGQEIVDVGEDAPREDAVWCPICETDDTELLTFEVGDVVAVRDQAAADAWGFQGELDGRIVGFGTNIDENGGKVPDALLSGVEGTSARWVPVYGLVKS